MNFGLPSRTSETIRTPKEPGFQGTLQVFAFDGTEDDQDLMDFMLSNKDAIADLKNSDVANAAKKLS